MDAEWGGIVCTLKSSASVSVPGENCGLKMLLWGGGGGGEMSWSDVFRALILMDFRFPVVGV
jgi:hypothetical protein